MQNSECNENDILICRLKRRQMRNGNHNFDCCADCKRYELMKRREDLEKERIRMNYRYFNSGVIILESLESGEPMVKDENGKPIPLFRVKKKRCYCKLCGLVFYSADPKELYCSPQCVKDAIRIMAIGRKLRDNRQKKHDNA